MMRDVWFHDEAQHPRFSLVLDGLSKVAKVEDSDRRLKRQTSHLINSQSLPASLDFNVSNMRCNDGSRPATSAAELADVVRTV